MYGERQAHQRLYLTPPKKRTIPNRHKILYLFAMTKLLNLNIPMWHTSCAIPPHHQFINPMRLLMFETIDITHSFWDNPAEYPVGTISAL
jgi:hypothetical protein